MSISCPCLSGWSGPGSRHQGYRRHGGGWQKLHEDSLHRSQDLVSLLINSTATQWECLFLSLHVHIQRNLPVSHKRHRHSFSHSDAKMIQWSFCAVFTTVCCLCPHSNVQSNCSTVFHSNPFCITMTFICYYLVLVGKVCITYSDWLLCCQLFTVSRIPFHFSNKERIWIEYIQNYKFSPSASCHL